MELYEIEKILIDKIKQMPERKKLKKIEEKIFTNNECLKLITAFQDAQNEYNYILKIYNENHKTSLEKRKILYEAKLNMDSNTLINEYNQLLIICNEPLRYLEYKLISLFQKGVSHKC